MEKIIKALEENRLYDDGDEKIISNNEDDFFKHYKLNKSNKNPLPSCLTRNKNGFLNLDDEPFIISDLKTDGHNDNKWILFKNGSRALLKSVDYNEISMELLFHELAFKLNIPSAKYDVATLNDKIFLISESFLSIDEYLFDYYNVEGKTFIDVEQLEEESKKISQDKHLKKTLFIDLLTNHYDRFPHNFKVITDGKNKSIAPLYDNGLCGIGMNYKLKFTFPEHKNSIDPKQIIRFLINDKKFKEWILFYIDNINPYYLKDKINQEKKIYVDSNMNELFIKNVKENQSIIKNVLKK